MASRRYKFVIKNSENGEFYGVLVAPNGQVMDMTETMTQKHNVLENLRSKQKAYSGALVVDETKNVVETIVVESVGEEPVGETEIVDETTTENEETSEDDSADDTTNEA